jgi:hypothetical protein
MSRAEALVRDYCAQETVAVAAVHEGDAEQALRPSQRSVPALPLQGPVAEVTPYSFSMPTTRRDAAMRMRPLPPADRYAAHLHNLGHRGWAVLPRLVPATQLARMRRRFDALIGRARRGECVSGAVDDAGIVEVARVYEEEPVFEKLMDLPPIYVRVSGPKLAGRLHSMQRHTHVLPLGVVAAVVVIVYFDI